MALTGLWGSKGYAWMKLNDIPLRKLRKLRDKYHDVPVQAFYPLQRNIESRTKPQKG